MNLASISASDFVKIAKLLKAKEVLLAKVADIDSELSSFEVDGRAKATGTKGPRIAKGPRAKRGVLKDTIIQLLKAAGKEGISVKDLATKTGVKGANIHAWFFTTGKKIKEIKKVGKSTHAWVD